MELGFNSDITVRGYTYHVQTEDWGQQYNIVVTKIFRDGVVVRSFKTPYEQILKWGSRDPSQALRLGIREQHQRILDLLSADQI